MGHETVLVIGNNFRDQLDKYQRDEYASPMNRHFVTTNMLERATKHYLSDTKRFLKHVDGSLHGQWDPQFWQPVQGAKIHHVPISFSPVDIPVTELISFVDWIKENYGFCILNEGAEPDILGKHKHGWVRINVDREVCEIIERTIPGGFLDWFESTVDILKLKPGAQGFVIDGEKEESATNGFAGSARKDAIDFDAMREVMRTYAAERWDRAATASGSQTWESFELVWKRYDNQKYSHELRIMAAREWAAQPAVQAIIDDCRIFPFTIIRLSAPTTNDEIEGARIDNSEWEQTNMLERLAACLVWNDQSESGIDPLALPRDQYVQRFGLRSLLGYSKVIQDGVLLEKNSEIPLLDSITNESLFTLVSVHS